MSRKRIKRGHIHIVWPSGQSVKLWVDERDADCTPETLARFARTCDAASKVIVEGFITAAPASPEPK